MKNNRKYALIIGMTIIALIASIEIIIKMNDNPEESIIRKFLKEYYTIDDRELNSASIFDADNDQNISENDSIDTKVNYLNDEISKYQNLLGSKCLNAFINNRRILLNNKFASENHCTLSVKKQKIEYQGKTADGSSNYGFTVYVEALYKDSTKKSTSFTGKIKMGKIDGKSMITGFDSSSFDNNYNF
jgi:hypothetical protein